VAGQPTAARAAVLVLFFLDGATLGSWVARIPAIKESLGLGEGALGMALFAMAVGALAAMLASGALVAQVGSRRATSASALLLCCLLPLPAVAPNLLALAASLAAMGVAVGVLDLSMNAQAVIVERCYRRPLMSSFHALFSIGGMAGAAVGGLVAARGVAPGPHFVAVGAGCALLALAASAGLLDEPGERTIDAPLLALPRGPLAALGLIAFCALLAEGAMADWSAVYLREALATSPALAAMGFTAFSVAMAVGRLGGDVATARLGPAGVVRLGASGAAVGLAGALLASTPLLAVCGLAVVGLGLATVFPLALRAAGRTVETSPPATRLAAVAGAGYTAFLVGPPVIGFVAEVTGLRAALALVVALCALAALYARRLGEPAPAEATASPAVRSE
jgi:MFS family permease